MRVTVAVAAACLGLVSMTSANDAKALVRQPTNIAAQELAPALNMLAKDRNVQLVYRSDLVKDQRTDGAAGDLTFEEVLTQLLNGTGLTYKFLENNAITILPIAANTPSQRDRRRAGDEASSVEAPRPLRLRLRLAQNSLNSSSDSQGQSSSYDGEAKESADTLAEVVVTAERRESTAQKTAASISVRTGEELASQGRYSLQDFLQDIPGTGFGVGDNSRAASNRSTDNPAADLVIRGIRSNVGTGTNTTSTSSSAAIYVDDVYNGLGSGYDIERVELLRGPQGTLYGRSATAGVLAVHTKAPNVDKFGADVSVEAGDYSLMHTSAGVNVPLADGRAALRVSGNYYGRDGFDTDNGGGKQINREGRVKLLLQPTENLTAKLGVAFAENDTRTPGVSIVQPQPDVFTFTPIIWGPGTNSARQYWAVVDLDLGAVALTYIPAFRTYKEKDIFYVRTPFANIDSNNETFKDHFHTQELRLRSNESDSRLQWQTGVMYYHNNLEDFYEVYQYTDPSLTSFFLGSRQLTDKETTQLGGFAEGTFSFSDVTRLTAGLRYDHTKVVTEQEYTSSLLVTRVLTAEEGTRTFNNLTYKLRLEHDLTASNMVYGLVSTGFSPGDVSVTTGANNLPEVVELDAETLTAFEIGSKNRFAGDRLQVNGAIYYNDYGAYQAANIDLTPGTGSITNRTIALPLTAYGAELEVAAKPWRGGSLSGSLAYTNAKYHDIPAQYASFFSVDDVEDVPPFTASVTYTHAIPIASAAELTFGGTVRYASSRYVIRVDEQFVPFGSEPYTHDDGEALVDLNTTLALAKGKYSISGYVRNLTDKRYKTYGNTNIRSAGTGATGNFVNSEAGLNAPRTWGVVFNAHF